MGWLGMVVASTLAGCVGVIVGGLVLLRKLGMDNRQGTPTERDGRPLLRPLLEAHFHPVSTGEITVSERKFPFRVRADLQRAIDQLFVSGTVICRFCGVQKDYDTLTITNLLVDGHLPAVSVPPQYEEVDIGESDPVRCLKNGLWFLQQGTSKYVVLFTPAGMYGQVTGILFQIATVNDEAGVRITQAFFRHLEESIVQAQSYRGKVLSLEVAENSYSGEATGITVHRLRNVTRDQVILPQKTLELLERNVIQFVQRRQQLSRFRQATRKGILFYGPPGTGKTHTIHYLAESLPGHTTLLISAEQVGLLSEYMTLARLLQPSMVVIEDADLIARERSQMGSPCEEALLNRLLNEMDGLKQDADILFILTTNRPEALEFALTSRPGRIDQAIEFPLPDEPGREKLIRLYSQGIGLDDELVRAVVGRTDRVSPAFIKELMRRSVQFHLERVVGSTADGVLQLADVENALEEMLFGGGSLNAKLLGAAVDACGGQEGRR